jgi:hypothetical protein
MNSEKYIGLDVHQATISVAVMDAKGKVVMESILETKATTILEFLAGLRGTLSVTFEEGTWAAWLYDLLKPHVANLVVCNPRKNALLKHGNKSDKIDARKLANLLRLNDLEPVYHDPRCPRRNATERPTRMHIHLDRLILRLRQVQNHTCCKQAIALITADFGHSCQKAIQPVQSGCSVVHFWCRWRRCRKSGVWDITTSQIIGSLLRWMT